jgi:hypothetical protein
MKNIIVWNVIEVHDVSEGRTFPLCLLIPTYSFACFSHYLILKTEAVFHAIRQITRRPISEDNISRYAMHFLNIGTEFLKVI